MTLFVYYVNLYSRITSRYRFVSRESFHFTCFRALGIRDIPGQMGLASAYFVIPDSSAAICTYRQIQNPERCYFSITPKYTYLHCCRVACLTCKNYNQNICVVNISKEKHH